MGIIVVGAIFVDIKGFPNDIYIPTGRNAGRIEYIHGGVSRNIAENIGNINLHPTFISIADERGLGDEVIRRLGDHGVDTSCIQRIQGGMGTWLAVFDNAGDLAGSISSRPDLMPILGLLEKKGDELFSQADSVVVEVDMDKEILEKILELSKRHHKKLYTIVSNMSIAAERRDLLKRFDCLVCNDLEAGIFFAEDYSRKSPEELCEIISERVISSGMNSMVVTMGAKGAVYADRTGDRGLYAARHVQVRDTTGAGDAFASGLAIGLTYGKSLREAVAIGTRLAASVITSSENVCPRFLPGELGIEI